jgi:hypothetical protein
MSSSEKLPAREVFLLLVAKGVVKIDHIVAVFQQVSHNCERCLADRNEDQHRNDLRCIVYLTERTQGMEYDLCDSQQWCVCVCRL